MFISALWQMNVIQPDQFAPTGRPGDPEHLGWAPKLVTVASQVSAVKLRYAVVKVSIVMECPVVGPELPSFSLHKQFAQVWSTCHLAPSSNTWWDHAFPCGSDLPSQQAVLANLAQPSSMEVADVPDR